MTRNRLRSLVVASACTFGLLGCDPDPGPASGSEGTEGADESEPTPPVEFPTDPLYAPDTAVAGRCTAAVGDPPSDPFADCLESFDGAPEAGYGHDSLPDVVLGPPVGGGAHNGSIDVASLGCNGIATLFFAPPGIVDGPGPDLVVFENPFVQNDRTFTEPAEVWVSDDGVRWVHFPCAVDGAESWPPQGCAGVTPTIANPENGLGADPERSGGDAFDLAELGLARASFVRLVDRTAAYYADDLWCEGASAGFDLDAVAAVDHGP